MMRFFQFQQQKNVDFKCVHIRQVSQKSPKTTLRLSKKPYERYKDMRLAINLLEKGENPIFRTLDQTAPVFTPQPLTSLDWSFGQMQTYTHMQFPSHRMRVRFQKSGIKYRSYLLRAKSVDRLKVS